MKAVRNKYLLLNHIFLASLLILLLNDHYLKYAYSNWLTGKLSDVAGIILLPLLLLYIFPRLKNKTILLSALLFVCWKSSFSQPIIDLYNQYFFVQTSRIVDYTDLLVLIFLFIPYLTINKVGQWNHIKLPAVNPMIMIIPTVIGLLATSPPPSFYYTRSNGNLICSNCNFTVEYNQDEIVEKLKKVNIVFDSIIPVDSSILKRAKILRGENAHFYKLNLLIIDKDS